MSLLVMGLSNVETTLAVDGFPIEYQNVRFPFNGIDSQVSGVGVNVALALKALGQNPVYLSLIAEDEAGARVQSYLEKQALDCTYVLKSLSATPQSVIQYDPSGKRQIYVDLKNIQDSSYPEPEFSQAAQDCQWLIMGTMNICRPYLSWAQSHNKSIACDLHAFSNINDDYHQDFLQHCKVLFLSNEHILGREQEFAQQLIERFYNIDIIVIGMGAQGALLFDRSTGLFTQQAALTLRPIVNTVGAGDALFSAFMHFYSQGVSAARCLKLAVLFASWKIGVSSASQGFLSQEELEKLNTEIQELK